MDLHALNGAVTQQEPERRFLQERIRQLKQKPRRLLEFHPAVRLCGEGWATGPPERASRGDTLCENLQVACRFPAAPIG
jgi:hypothetical protein